MLKSKIFIDGDSGTTGLGIRDRLAGRTDLELIALPQAQRKDLAAKQHVLSQVDLTILCLPDEAAEETVALCDALGAKAPRILDASTAHRTAPGWIYGFPELCANQAQEIAKAQRVANVGCYATGAIALLRPLIDAQLLPSSYPLAINAVSGYSGGGRQMIESYEKGEAAAFELYSLGHQHKHIPEIMAYARLERPPIFAPSVGNFRQGMLVSIPLALDALPKKVTAKDLQETYQRHYHQAPHVHWVAAPTNGRLDALALNNTDDMEVYVFSNETLRQIILVARLDNLGKGASGAAVQNLNLMLSKTQ